MCKVEDFSYLIIGGTTKAGTTSLFNWLKDHPEVCTSSWKETGFFLDRDYPVLSQYRYDKDGMEKYNEFFKQCRDSELRVEATPDYLHSRGTSLNIKKSLPDAKLTFILRDPVARFISWYRFSKQWNFISKDVSIEQYIESNQQQGPKPQHWLVMEQGRYSEYLKSYIDIFDNEKILILFLEDVSKNPFRVMKEICGFADINEAFFSEYDFRVENPTVELKHPSFYNSYGKIRFFVRKYTHNKPFIHSRLSFLRRKFDSLYFMIDSHKTEKQEIPCGAVEYMCEYYKDEYDGLAKLLGKPVPWRFEKWLSQ